MPDNYSPYTESILSTSLDEVDPELVNNGIDEVFMLKSKFLKGRRSNRTKLCNCFICEVPIFDGDQAFRYSGKDDSGERKNIYCGQCSSKFVRCKSCRGNFLPTDLFMSHCPQCVDDAPNNYIRNYSTKVARELPKIGEAQDGIYFGVELEYESTGNYGKDVLVTDSLIRGFSIMKKDSSIKRGFEVVSSPGSIEAHVNNFGNLFKNLPRSVQPDVTCGMHVHVSRVRLSDLQIGKMLSFIHNPDNEKFISIIAGRPSSHHNDFKRPKKITEGLYGGKNQVCQDRHTALNLNNQETIEFRLFKSTRDIFDFTKNLQFCRAVVKFTDWSKFSISESKDFKTFFGFVRQNRKEYDVLWNFLTRAKIFDRFK